MVDAVNQLLEQFARFGVDLGLERIERLLADLGNPQQQVPIVHVAGSNGKGSVCAYLSAVLTQAGYRVGRYISPHLIDWTERICINDTPIASTQLSYLLQQVVEAIQPDYPSPTQFEVFTAAAWLYFAQQQVDIAVIEVGLGGRLDATNVCDRPLVSIITPLSREHWQRLGPTLADISREKAGILKPGCPAVIAPLPSDAQPVIYQRLQELGCPVVFPQPATELENGWAQYEGSGIAALATPPNFSHLRYRLPLPGAHQLTNSALAIAALQVLQQQGWALAEADIVQGLSQTRWPGRLQWLTWNGSPLLIDGAHNAAGAAALRHYVDHSAMVKRPVTWVLGMLSNKDHDEIFRALLREGDRLFLVPVPDHDSAELESLLALASDICPTLADCRSFANEAIALDAAFKTTDPTLSTTILCGSLYLIGHFLQHATRTA